MSARLPLRPDCRHIAASHEVTRSAISVILRRSKQRHRDHRGGAGPPDRGGVHARFRLSDRNIDIAEQLLFSGLNITC